MKRPMHKAILYITVIVVIIISAFYVMPTSSGIDDHAVIDGIIISKNSESSTKLNYFFSVLKFEDIETSSKFEFNASTLAEAVNLLEVPSSRRPFFGQAQYIIINQKLDKTEVIENLSYIASELAFPPNTTCVAVTDSAEKYIHEKKLDGRFLKSLSNIDKVKTKNITLMLSVSALLSSKSSNANLCLLDVKDNELTVCKNEKW